MAKHTHFFDARVAAKPAQDRDILRCHVKGCGQVTNGHKVPAKDGAWLDVCGFCLDFITGRRAAR